MQKYVNLSRSEILDFLNNPKNVNLRADWSLDLSAKPNRSERKAHKPETHAYLSELT